MRLTNPKYVLRNYLAQSATARADEGDYSEIERLPAILRRPFEEPPEHEVYAKLPPDWAGICPQIDADGRRSDKRRRQGACRSFPASQPGAPTPAVAANPRC
ncbi:hypothetical protein T5B8_12333 [Salinisphaera sp. T5B8]